MASSCDYDLVIVGASFAGLTCARAAALRGAKVCVLEAKPDPGARVHTTGILVKEAAEEIDVPAELTKVVHGVRLYAPNLKSIDLFSPGYYFQTTRTGDLLRWLGEEAQRAGAEIRCGFKFRGGTRVDEGIHIDGADISCRYVIGADGAKSSVAEAFGLGRNEKFLVGVETEYSDVEGMDERFLHCFLDSQLAPGYISWVAPAPGIVQVGTATNDRFKPDLERFRQRIDGLFRFDPEKIVERRSGVIPCGGVVEKFADHRVMLIGDAAGLVSPHSAGGIQLAFRLGRRAGQAVADHLLRYGPPPEQIIAPLLPAFRKKKLIRRALDMPPPNVLIDGLLSTPPMRWFARRVYFHNRLLRDIGLDEFADRLSAPN